MKIILTQDVENLGSLGDTVDVKPGYGRNYLIPQGVALLATGKASKELLGFNKNQSVDIDYENELINKESSEFYFNNNTNTYKYYN